MEAFMADKAEKDTISFGFDSLDILGAFGNDIYIKGFIYFMDDDNKEDTDCVIVISRELFNKAFILWLDSKKDFCERYGHFCGVQGHIDSNDYEEIGNYRIIDEIKIQDENCRDYLKNVRAFKIISFEEIIDMEHG